MPDKNKAWEKLTKKLSKTIFEAKKYNAFYLCLGMTGSGILAEGLTVQAMQAMWESLTPGDYVGEGILSVRYLQKALELSRDAEISADLRPEELPFWYELEEGQKELFVLRYLISMNNKDIAAYLNQPVRRITGACTALDGHLAQLLERKFGINCGTGAAVPIHIRQQITMEQNRQSFPSQPDQAFASLVAERHATLHGHEGKANKKVIGLVIGLVVAVAAVAGIMFGMVLNAGSSAAVGTYYAEIVIQDYGTITVALDAEAAPETVANFVSLAESGFYDGLTFHRIIEGFMMQGGDPNGDGTGGSEDTIVGEFSDNGYDNDLSHTRGAISMARSSDYDSASSQFFIVQEDSVYLDGSYACFGYVVDGMDIVDQICEEAEPTDDNGSIASEDQPIITTIIIYTADEYGEG